MESLWLYTQPGNLDPEFCRRIVDKFGRDNRIQKGLVAGGLMGDLKRTTDLTVSDKQDWREEDVVFAAALTKGLVSYKSHLEENAIPLAFPMLHDTGYQVQKYRMGVGFYEWHQDFLVLGDGRHREYTFIWYLNTVDTGGETEFFNGAKIKPEVGKLLLFPSTWTWIHRGRMPESSDKYICTGWLVTR